MAFEYCTTIYHHILTNTSPAATVFVFATLQTNTIIAHIKCRVHNQCILARFQIQTITILRITRITNLYFFYQHILTHQRMQVPCRWILENHTLQPYILTLYQAHHHRTKKMTHTLPFFLGFQILRYVHITDSIPFQRLRIREPVGGTFIYPTPGDSLFPYTFCYFLPFQRTPIMSVTINGTFSRYRYIFQITSGDRRLATAGIQSFKYSLY